MDIVVPLHKMEACASDTAMRLQVVGNALALCVLISHVLAMLFGVLLFMPASKLGTCCYNHVAVLLLLLLPFILRHLKVEICGRNVYLLAQS